MRKSHLSIFLCFTLNLLAFSVQTYGASAEETSKKTKSSKPTTESSTKSTDSNAKVDLNTASEKDLESLPGVGSATAKKIVSGRPYSSIDDLSKAGLSAGTVKKITPLVTVSGAAAAAPTKAPATATNTPPSAAKPTKTAIANAKVDLNTASEKDLEGLPGVGSATAKKIVAGRPFSSIDDLSKAGVSANTIKKISPLVMVSGGAPAAASTKVSPPPASQPTPTAPSRPAPASPAKATASSAPQGAPGPGMVWVNLTSGIYHHSGSQFYGKTKNGKYMSEEDAIKAGYHAAKNEKNPK